MKTNNQHSVDLHSHLARKDLQSNIKFFLQASLQDHKLVQLHVSCQKLRSCFNYEKSTSISTK